MGAFRVSKEYVFPVYNLIKPLGGISKPILISIPHAGTEFPAGTREHYQPDAVSKLDDTDWFVDRLYSFATNQGITIIKANYSRWLIDLNRDIHSKALYNDGRAITDLIPAKSFSGTNIYLPGKEPDKAERERRINEYYKPYYKIIADVLTALKSKFGKALLFDAHSIKSSVSSISNEPFKALTLGTVDEKSAAKGIINVAEKVLSDSAFSFSHNSPFKGGNITRSFAQPLKNIHSMQLEITQSSYMDEKGIIFLPRRASKLQSVLEQMFEQISSTMKRL